MIKLLKYFIAQKKYWLLPVVFLVVLLGFIIAIGGSTLFAPLIYSLF
jgi:hypothetical protein